MVTIYTYVFDNQRSLAAWHPKGMRQLLQFSACTYMAMSSAGHKDTYMQHAGDGLEEYHQYFPLECVVQILLSRYTCISRCLVRIYSCHGNNIYLIDNQMLYVPTKEVVTRSRSGP